MDAIRLLALPILADMADTTRYRTVVNGVERIWVPPYHEQEILDYVGKAIPASIECQALEPLGEPFTIVTASATP